MSENGKKKELSRRDFIKGSGIAVGALTLAAGAPKLLDKPVMAAEATPLPWEYVALDP
ncbi:MAG: twin-arginine translocation signal domain-containing protein, partial [Anaerolineales bacterium]|nr:twin-arginine translocation signal domain-containing protein [Anaerolineales bacterium]